MTTSPDPRSATRPAPADGLRAAMLAQLQGCTGPAAARLRLRLSCTLDPDTLWHLRPRLMEILAAERGEGEARRCVQEVDSAFRQHWPAAPTGRPARVH